MSTFIEICLCIMLGTGSLMGLIALAVMAVMAIGLKRDYFNEK
jgi:hypothetical protein